MKLFPISRYKIVGHSMHPSYKEGQVVWVNNLAFFLSKPKVGDVVVFHFQNKAVIKRITAVGKTAVEVVGDNKNDSLEVGSTAIKSIVGKVLT